MTPEHRPENGPRPPRSGRWINVPIRARGFPDAQSCGRCALYNPKVYSMDDAPSYGKCIAFGDTGRVPWVSSECVCRRFREDPHANEELCNVDGCHVAEQKRAGTDTAPPPATE